MPPTEAWLAPLPLEGTNFVVPVPLDKFVGAREKAIWLPGETMAKAWMEYVRDTGVTDETPPPAPRNLRLIGEDLTWEAEADVGAVSPISLSSVMANSSPGFPISQRIHSGVPSSRACSIAIHRRNHCSRCASILERRRRGKSIVML